MIQTQKSQVSTHRLHSTIISGSGWDKMHVVRDLGQPVLFLNHPPLSLPVFKVKREALDPPPRLALAEAPDTKNDGAALGLSLCCAQRLCLETVIE